MSGAHATAPRETTSPISGWGVYGDRAHRTKTRIVEYTGQLVSQAEAWRREHATCRGGASGSSTQHALGADAAFGGNVARYMNHACRPNCYTEIEGARSGSSPRAESEKAKSSPTTTTPRARPGSLLCRPGCRRML